MRYSIPILALAVVLAAPQARAHPDHSQDSPRGARGPASAPAAKEYGRPGGSTGKARTVQVEMTDKGTCNPAEIAAKQGETLRLVAKNSSRVAQDLAIGTAAELKSHTETVRKFPGMQGSRVNRVSAKPGESAELVWQFTKAGQFAVACAAPDQFDATNAGKVVVSGR